jgi:DNA-binding NtrC family response regulator
VRIWIIEDDAGVRRLLGDTLRRARPDAGVVLLADCREACEADGRADVILVDVSAIAGRLPLSMERSLEPMRLLADRHPGATIAVMSAMLGWADRVALAIRRETGMEIETLCKGDADGLLAWLETAVPTGASL